MEKTKFVPRLLAAAFLAASAAAVPAVQAADAGDAPKNGQEAGAYIDDSVITAKVKAVLVGDKQVSAMKITVTTKDGVVTLKGAVPSAEVGQHALQLAAGVDGVKDVKSELTVKTG
ncbi:BON domain-containing protein [Herbaspirillum sp.]|uniref:BON domain-containing protein n=1 Tax=Herbaspirillum sp. TaxID=1890675 RepID=UPI001B2478A4|nr:BON domain-containing protein [Herbaspirillum sp.]MBO9537701.1 BON domain-containing protein [Herbaspirillum sp.]